MTQPWIHLVAPDAERIAELVRLGIPAALLAHLGDPQERPRTEHDGSTLLVVLHYPLRRGADAAVPYVTAPLSLVLTEAAVITVSPYPTDFLEGPVAEELQGIAARDRTRFVLRLLMLLAQQFLVCHAEIEDAVDQLESRLRRSLRNEEVLELLRYEKSLVWFITALKGDEMVLERLRRAAQLRWDTEDLDVLEDVLIELRQAIEMVDITQNILGQMMDAFASIVSNNLNAVMKVLTSATILIAVPTLIASLYGMNVGLPGARSPVAFAGILLGSLALTAVLVTVFRRRNWL